MPALKLDDDEETLALPPDPSQKTVDDPGIGVMDYGKAALSGVPGLGASVASGLQYLTGAGEDSYLAGARRASERGQKAVTESMSPGAQKALSANIMPTEGGENDIWDRGASGAAAAVGLKTAASLPSLLATLIPGTLVARLGLAGAAAAGATEAGAAAFGASAGTAAAGAAGGLMSGGDVFQQIQNGILEMPDAQLQDENDVYAGLRDMGLSEDEAKGRVINRAAGYKPLYMAAITAMTARLGNSAEALFAGKAAGKAAGTAGSRITQALKTGGTEFASEFGEESSGELMKQQGAAQAGGTDFQADWAAAIEAGLQGGVAGFGLGGVSGAVGHQGGTHQGTQTGDADVDSAAGAPPYAPHPEGEETEIPIDIAHVRPNNRRKVVDTSTATSPEQMDAAAGTAAANAPTSVNEQATADLSQVDANLERMEEDAKAANSVVQPAVPGATAPVPGVREAAVTAAATPVPVVTPAGKVDPAIAAAMAPRPVPQDEDLGEDPDAYTVPALPPQGPVVTPEVQAIITNPSASAPLPPAAPDVAAPPSSGVAPGPAAGGAAPVAEPVLTNEARLAAKEEWREGAPPEVSDELIPLSPRADQRRVLRDVNEPAPVVEAPAAPAVPRVSKGDAIRAAQGDIAAVENLTTNPEEFADHNDRRKIWRAVENMKKAGEITDPDWAEIASLQGKLSGKQGKPNMERLRAARQRIADKVTAAAPAPVVAPEAAPEAAPAAPVAKTKAEQRAEVKAAEKAARIASQAAIAKDIVDNAAYTDDVRDGKPEAMEKYIRGLVRQAQDEGLPLGSQVRDTTDLHVALLIQARDALKAKANRKGAILDFMATDLAFRNGDTTAVREFRRAQAAKAGASTESREQTDDGAETKKETYDEDTGAPDEVTTDDEVFEGDGDESGTDRSEIYDREEVAEALSEDAEPVEGGTGVQEVEREPEEVARERPTVALAEGQGFEVVAPVRAAPVVVGRGRRKATAVIEARTAREKLPETDAEGRRVVTPEGKPTPAPISRGEAIKRAVKNPNTNVGATVALQREEVAANADVVPNPRTARDALSKAKDLLESAQKAIAAADFPYKAQALRAVQAMRSKHQNLSMDLAAGDFDRIMRAEDSRQGMFGDALARFGSGPGFTADPKIPQSVTDAINAWHQAAQEAVELATPRMPLMERAGEATAPVNRDGYNAKGDFETNVKAMLAGYDMESFPGIARHVMSTTAKRVLRLAGDVKIRIVSRNRMLEIYAAENRGREFDDIPDGFYNPNTDEIILLGDKLKDDTEGAALVLHEAVHAAFRTAIENRPDLKRFVDGLLDTAKKRWDEIHPNDAYPYGFKDHHEFISEALSNRKFMEFLNETKAGFGDRVKFGRTIGAGPEKSVWSALLDKIKQTLGFAKTDSTLEYLIRAVHTMDTGRTRELTPMQGKFAPLARFETLQDTREGNALTRKIFGYKVITLDQLRQQARGLFPTSMGDAVERVVAALQRREAGIRAHVALSHGHAETFLNIKQQDHKEGQRASELMIDATIANVNLVDKAGATAADLAAANPHWGKDAARDYQGKAQAARLQAEFMKLKPETRRAILDAAAFYRNTQNELTATRIENLLETLQVPLTPAQNAAIVTKAMNGLLDDDADRKLVDNDTVYNALRDTGGFRAIKGLYFPLVRQGNFIVRTTSAIGNTFGGKVVGDVVEFSGDEKTARAAYKRFAENTDLDVTSVGKQYREVPGGKVISAVDAKGRPHEVVYRARVMTQGLHVFDSPSEAARFIRQNKGQFKSMDQKPMPRAQMESGDDLTHRQFNAILKAAEARNIDPTAKAMLKSTLQQASIQMMAGNRIQHRMLKRRGVRGASDDQARNMIQYGEASGRALAKARYMPEVRAAMADARTMLTTHKDDIHAQDRSIVYQELEKRVDQGETNLDANPQWLKDVMALSFLDKLFSPAYSVVNGMQPWMVTGPVLGGEFGFMQAGHQLTKAYNTIGGLGVIGQGLANTGRAVGRFTKAGIDSSDVVGSIRRNLQREPDGKALMSLFDQLVDRGAIDAQAGMEIAGSISEGRGVWGTGLAKADRIARQLPVAVEAVNRSVTAVAAYRLSRAAGKSHDAAVAYAFDTVQNTQGDYSNVNAPRFFNNPIMKAPLQFKKYAQMMSYLMVDMVKRAGFNTREKRIASKQLMGVIGVQVAMAGALGLPGLELLKVGVMIAGALGLTDDDWGDVERWIRGIAEDAIGKTPAELVTRGVISRAANLDLSTRVGLNDMWTFGEPKSTDREGLLAYSAQLLGGAPGTLMVDWATGLQAASNGDWTKAAIQMVPNKLASDFLKAYSGRTDPNASQPMTTYDAALQVAGFRSGRLAEAGEKVGQSVDASADRETERKRLQDAYLKARTRGEQTKLKAQIKAHNEAKGTTLRQKVFPGALDKIRAKRDKERAELLGG